MDALFLAIPNQRVIAANPAACVMFGRTEAELCQVGRAGIEDPTDPRHAIAVAKRTRTGSVKYEATHVRKDGTAFPTEVSSVIMDGGTRSLVIIRDITERKHAEEALRVSEDRYHRLFDSMTEGFLLAELIRDDAGTPVDFRILEANLAYEPILGCQREAAIGKTLFEVFPGLDIDRFAAIAHVAQTGEPLRWQGVFAPTGRCYENVYYSPRPGQLAGIFTDITKRKQAEEALRESEERYRGASVGSFDAFFLLEAVRDAQQQLTDFEFVDVNSRAEELLGISRESIIGQKLCELIPINRTGGFFEKYVRVMASGETLEEEFSIATSEIKASWLRHQVVAVGNGVAITSRDITERKRAEEALHASLHEKEVLLKEIHHRVKNNMQVISSLVNLQSDTLDDPALRALFNDLRDQMRTMALVHEKLYQSESLANIDFAEYTQSLLSYIWRAHGGATADIRLTLDMQPVSISIEQAVPCGLILNELVTNALKHAFRDRAAGELTVALRADLDGQVCLSVSDNGVGLPADWRHSPSLGLQLVQMLTRQVRGTLDVRTDGGTAFSLTFAQSTPPQHGGDQHA